MHMDAHISQPSPLRFYRKTRHLQQPSKMSQVRNQKTGETKPLHSDLTA